MNAEMEKRKEKARRNMHKRTTDLTSAKYIQEVPEFNKVRNCH